MKGKYMKVVIYTSPNSTKPVKNQLKTLRRFIQQHGYILAGVYRDKLSSENLLEAARDEAAEEFLSGRTVIRLSKHDSITIPINS
jgi:CRISPR/Cas system-associated protein endoribonuclease Cas2